MNTLALKYHRKQNQQRQKEAAIKGVIARACKRGGIGVNFATSEAVINALDKYISDLREIDTELRAKYPGATRELWRIGAEINTAIKAIAWERIQQVKPD